MEPYLDKTGLIVPTVDVHNTMNQAVYGQSQGYKSLRPIHDNNSKFLSNSNDVPTTDQGSQPAYMNTNGSDVSDSVKYYVLEDATKWISFE